MQKTRFYVYKLGNAYFKGYERQIDDFDFFITNKLSRARLIEENKEKESECFEKLKDHLNKQGFKKYFVYLKGSDE